MFLQIIEIISDFDLRAHPSFIFLIFILYLKNSENKQIEYN